MQALYSAFDFLIHPTFFDRDNPPLKVNVSAKTMGLIAAILGVLFLLFALALLPVIFAIGTMTTVLGVAIGEPHPGILPIALLGMVIAILTDILWIVGGWKLYKEDAEGRDMLIVALAVNVIASLVLDIGLAQPTSVIWTLIWNAIIYYFVAISRLPQEGKLTELAPAGGTAGGYTPPQGGYTPPAPTYTEPTQTPSDPYQPPPGEGH